MNKDRMEKLHYLREKLDLEVKSSKIFKVWLGILQVITVVVGVLMLTFYGETLRNELISRGLSNVEMEKIYNNLFIEHIILGTLFLLGLLIVIRFIFELSVAVTYMAMEKTKKVVRWKMSQGVEFPTVQVTEKDVKCQLHIEVDTELYLKLFEEDPSLCQVLKRRLSVAAEAIIRSYLN